MSQSTNRRMRLVVNGKAAADPLLRESVKEMREQGYSVEVRVTWEFGDAARYSAEAVQEGVDVVVAAGGDGTVNEVAGGMLTQQSLEDVAMAVIPYGTANDFAGGNGIQKGDPLTALQLAATGTATMIDVGKVNDRIFVNVTSGGFGAEVTTTTPPELKKALGGAAYSLMGIVTAAKMNPYECRFTGPDGTIREGKLLLISVGNGRQAGGGYQVAPNAVLNDGLLDVMVVHDVELPQMGLVLNELVNYSNEDNKFVAYRQVPSFQLECTRPLYMSIDGEAYQDTHFEFKVLPRVLPFILGPNAVTQA